jgi:ABC-type sugar transport system permease subunit
MIRFEWNGNRVLADRAAGLAAGVFSIFSSIWPLSVRSTTASPTGTASTPTTLSSALTISQRSWTDPSSCNAAINTAIWMVAALVLPTALGLMPGASSRHRVPAPASSKHLLPADLPFGGDRRPDLDLDLSARLGPSEHRHRDRHREMRRFNFAWLAKPDTALGSVIVAWSWQQTGLAMVIYLAGLTAIPRDLLEVCEIEGAAAGSVSTSWCCRCWRRRPWWWSRCRSSTR